MNIEYDVFKKRFDVTQLLKGLLNNLDQCPHWGIVVKSQISLKYDGKEETVKAGDAYYIPPGHTGIFEEGTELWEFSPNKSCKKLWESSSQLSKLCLKRIGDWSRIKVFSNCREK